MSGMIRSRAPVRIDFAGGWTDVPPFSAEAGGFVVNATITRYAYAALTPSPDGEYRLESGDYDTYVEARDIRQMEYDGNLDLLKAAVRRMDLSIGGHIVTRSDAPPGSGTGSSASMGVALVGLLAEATCRAGACTPPGGVQAPALQRAEIAALANKLEIEELRIQGGRQDQYAAALGGISFMGFKDPEVTTERLAVSRDFLYELEKHLLLIYTGKSRLSGDIISRVMGAYQSGDGQVRTALMNLRQAAQDMKAAFLAEDLERVGEVLDFNWENQKLLYPEMTTPKTEALLTVARPEGVLGAKACGAGGGGCILLLCDRDREHHVRRAVTDLGGIPIDFNFDHDGLQTWRPQGRGA
ncbi:GHMP kinase [bacterium]|nr:GHMP kinase [bacterium]